MKTQLELEIEELKNQLEGKQSQLYEKQNKCGHTWSPVKYDPEETFELISAGISSMCKGSDIWYDTKRVPKTTSRWSRKCTLCGKVEYTKEQVVVKMEPKF